MEKDFKRREYYLTFEKLNKFEEEEPEDIKFKRLVNAIYDFLKIDGVEIKNFSSDINIDIQDLDRQIVVEAYITTSGKAVIEINDFTKSHLILTEKSLIREVEVYLLSQCESYKDRISTDQGIRFNFDTAFEGL